MFLRSKLPKSIELVTLQGPIETPKPADEDIARVKGPYYQWWMDASDAKGPGDINSSVRKALDYAAAFVATDGPFDAVLGFSQGAAMATMLTHFLSGQPAAGRAAVDADEGVEGGETVETGGAAAAGSGGASTPLAGPRSVLPWNGNICVCAGAIPNKEWELEYTQHPLHIPSLHILGERDKVCVCVCAGIISGADWGKKGATVS